MRIARPCVGPFVLILALLAGFPALLYAQESPGTAVAEPEGAAQEEEERDLVGEFLEREQPEAGDQTPEDGSPLPDLASLPEDEATREAVRAAHREYYRQRAAEYRHRGDTLRWQLLSTKITFVVVVLLVLTGVVFSGIQFRIALQGLRKGREPETTEVRLSGQGIEVRSSILGVVLLVISLGFFYLYLVYVYPIKVL